MYIRQHYFNKYYYLNPKILIKKSNDKNSPPQQKTITQQHPKKYPYASHATRKMKIDATINRRNTRRPLTI